jgi:hypothetical protein
LAELETLLQQARRKETTVAEMADSREAHFRVEAVAVQVQREATQPATLSRETVALEQAAASQEAQSITQAVAEERHTWLLVERLPELAGLVVVEMALLG